MNILKDLDEYLSVLPNDDDSSDISKNTDENGNPVDDKIDKKIKESEGTWWEEQADQSEPIPSMSSLATVGLVTTDISTPQVNGFNHKLPLCPVFVDRDTNGNRHYTAYILGPINDVDDYIDLIDTLLVAKESDTYDVIIDSPGGLIASGSFISSAIYHTHAQVRTISRGLCASAGALVHSAPKDPKNAIAMPTSIHMYHMSSHFDYGYSTLIAFRAAQQVRYVNECLLVPAKQAGHISQEEFELIQSGEEVYISGTRFNQHQQEVLQALAKQEETTPEPTFDNANVGMESYKIKQQFKDDPDKSQIQTFPFFITPSKLAEMCGCRENPEKQNALLVRTNDQKNFRVYMKASYDFSTTYLAKLNRFLDSRTPDQTVTFILGTRMDDSYSANRSASIISAMQTCRAKVITVMAGWGSIGESFIWLFGKERYIFKYGGLTFNIPDTVKWCPEFKHYYNYMFAKAMELKILSQEDVNNIIKTKIDHQILESDYKKLSLT